jgi:hypothetical protein
MKRLLTFTWKLTSGINLCNRGSAFPGGRSWLNLDEQQRSDPFEKEVKDSICAECPATFNLGDRECRFSGLSREWI